tara:strand:- start:661 stop:891 length:231 start_codon:yes stop_codon:yes gene_type:complete
MKAILEFNLPNEKWEFKIANESSAMHSVLWDMDQWLRGQTKYGPDDMSEDTYNAFELCRETLHEFLNNEYINLNEE